MPEHIRIAKVRYGGKVYQIPVGPDGLVPRRAIVQRFQEVGDVRDLDSTSNIVLPADCTPQQIIQWWADPSSCDIQGIDTEDSEVYNMDGVPQTHIHAQKRIGIVAASPESQKRIRRILSEHFSAEELERMVQNGGFVIKTLDDCGSITGCYYRSSEGMEIPLIVIEDNGTPDGIVHEVVHHSRAVDPTRQGLSRTNLKEPKKGRLSKLFTSWRKKDIEEEECMTVAETVVRTGRDPIQSGYYDRLDGVDPRTAYLQDRRTLQNLPYEIPDYAIPKLKGKAAKDAVLSSYAYSNIAKALILKDDEDE